MRRRPPPPAPLPEQLTRLVPVEWSADLDEACIMWRDARWAHLIAHRDDFDGIDYIKHTGSEIRRVKGLPPLGGYGRRP